MLTPGLPILSFCAIYEVRQLDYVPVSNIDEILEIDSMLGTFLL